MPRKKLLNVVVKRARWYRGAGASDSALRRDEDGKMCCLGFACMAAGMRARDIVSVAMPYDIEGVKRPAWGQWATPEIDAIAATNDRQSITDAEREKRLKQLGRAIGLRFSFVD